MRPKMAWKYIIYAAVLAISAISQYKPANKFYGKSEAETKFDPQTDVTAAIIYSGRQPFFWRWVGTSSLQIFSWRLENNENLNVTTDMPIPICAWKWLKLLPSLVATSRATSNDKIIRVRRCSVMSGWPSARCRTLTSRSILHCGRYQIFGSGTAIRTS